MYSLAEPNLKLDIEIDYDERWCGDIDEATFANQHKQLT
jgi:hypothetical protein